MIRAKVTIRRRGNLRGHVRKIEKAISGPTKVKVGLPAGKSDADLVQIGIWNHFGTGGSQTNFLSDNGIGGFGGPIPARPFITVAMFKHRGAIRIDLQRAAKLVIDGSPMGLQLAKLGQKGSDFVKQTIQGGVGAPNAPLTIKIKGSSKQLIDNGRLFAGITWALDDGAGGAALGLSGGKK